MKTLEPFILGGISSCTAEIFTFPIDLVKTRLQIQGQTIESSILLKPKYAGMFNCFNVVIKEEGLKALYGGLFKIIKIYTDKIFKYLSYFSIKPALLRQATYGTLKLGFYQYIKKILNKNFKGTFVLIKYSVYSSNFFINHSHLRTTII
jgi:solute carrier family 25 protein 14/30